MTNLLKAMLCLNHYLLISLTLYMSPHSKWAHTRYSPHLLRGELLWAHSCDKHPHRWRSGGPGGRLLRGVWWGLGVVSSWLDGVKEIILVRIIYSRLFCKTFSLCNKVCDIRLYTLSHCMCWSSLAHIWDAPGFPLKSGCDNPIIYFFHMSFI